MVGLFVLAALLADLIAPYDPTAQNLQARLRPPFWVAGSSLDYPLGTDPLGRDVLSRLLHGARVSLLIGGLGTFIGLTAGVLSGLVSGFARGMADEVMMFLVDAYLSLPFLIVALTVITLFGGGLPVLIVVVGFSSWAQYTRLARGETLRTRVLPYVLAARAMGAGRVRLLRVHILPNIAAPMIVLATLELTSIILLEASLSFLGLGVKPPTASWGSMLGEGRTYLHSAPWVGVLPGLALMGVTISISLLGDWLRDLLDPTLRER